MKIINTQEELNGLLSNGNLIISDSLKINCNIELDGDIKAQNIDAWNIEYYAFCVTYHSLLCKSIQGKRDKSIHACLDSEIKIKK